MTTTERTDPHPVNPVTVVTAKERAERLAASKLAAKGRVDLSKLERTVTITEDRPGEHTVRVTYTAPGLDRSDGYAWSCGTAKTAPQLARRLKTAIEAGAVFSDPEILVDVNGRTYVSVASKVYARQMNADLRKLGY